MTSLPNKCFGGGLKFGAAVFFGATSCISLCSSIASATVQKTYVRSIAVGAEHGCALLSVRTIKCWGVNGNGQLGYGGTSNPNTVVTVKNINTAIAITAGTSHTCALLAGNIFGGTIKCWGDNTAAQLGDPSGLYFSSTPVPVYGIKTAIAISAGGYHTCALLSSGSVECWGRGSEGQLGTGGYYISVFSSPVSLPAKAIAISAGLFHTCALLLGGTVYCWGEGSNGQLGQGFFIGSPTPVKVAGITAATAISAKWFHTCARFSGGNLKCWGNNNLGQLGNTAIISTASPVIVNNITTATAVSTGGYFTCAPLSGGTIKCWGINNYGQLGNATTTNSLNPVKVDFISTAVAVSSGGYHSCALLSLQLAVMCWGSNQYYQLGTPNGFGSYRMQPVQVIGVP